jgi:predicted amidophosphoribosyltransferase
MEQTTQTIQKMGHWIIDRDDNRTWDRVRFICSDCGEWQTYGKTKYCPECGKPKMQEGGCGMTADIYERPCGYGWDKSKVVRHHFCPNCGRAVDSTEQEPCTDAISRQAVLEIQEKYAEHIGATKFWQMRDDIKALQPVTPQPKMGRWIDIMVGDIPAQACDKCKAFYPLAYTGGGHKYCPNCGRKMQEVKE